MAKEKSLEEEFLAGDMLLDDTSTLLNEDDNEFDGDDENQDDEDSDDDADDTGNEDDDDVLDNDPDDDDDDDDEDDEDDEDKDDADDKSKDKTPSGKAKPAAEAKGDDIDEEGTEHYYRALYWQEQGIIPKDATPSPKMTQLEFEDLYQKSIHANVVNEYRGQIKGRLVAKGINPDEILLGPQNQDIYLRDNYKIFTNVTYDDLIENATDEDEITVTDTVKNLGSEFYRSSNPKLDAEAIETLVQKDLDKLTEETAFEKYQKHFIAEVKRLDKKIVDDEKAVKLKETQKAESDAATVRQLLESGDIGKRKHTPEEIAPQIIDFIKKIMWPLTVRAIA